ncbi:MAG: hypothetical protein AAF685_03205 [Cyanobacteria bacterium P01_C01_bin.89]
MAIAVVIVKKSAPKAYAPLPTSTPFPQVHHNFPPSLSPPIHWVIKVLGKADPL